MALSTEDRFNLEVLRLLLHLAWADGTVAEAEEHLILGLGRSWLVPEPELHRLKESIRAGQRPGELDYPLLRTRSDDVLQAASALVAADGKIAPEETALLKKVKAALSS
jgi:tellurite resistance protein